MRDYKELIERLRMPTQEFKNLHNEAADALERLTAERDELLANAARWKHVRDNGVYCLQYEYGECGVGSYRGEDADETVDEAIARVKGK